MTNEQNRKQYFELMKRYNALSRLLPSEEEILDDTDKIGEARIILAELAVVKRQLDEWAVQ